MERLQELITILNKNKLKKVEVIGKSTNGDSMLSHFYNGIHDGLINSNEEALTYLYENTPNKNAYYKLKTTLQNKLLNTLVLIPTEFGENDPRKQAYLACQKRLAALNILININSSKQSAVWLAKKLLKKAIYWRFSEIVLSTARFLRSYHASKTGNRVLFTKYNSIVLDFLELYTAETTIESYYADFLSYHVLNKSTKLELYELAEKYIQKIEIFHPKVSSAKFIYMKAMLHIAKYMSINDYAKTIEICKKTLEKLKLFEYLDLKASTVISFQLIACCIQLKEYETGSSTIKYLLQVQKEGLFNWFKTKELSLNLYLHTKKYHEAWETFTCVYNHTNFQNLPCATQEIWRIYEAWLNFLLASNEISLNPNSAMPKKKFKIAKFLNEVNIFSKDKKGLNIPILVVYLLFLVQRQEHNQFIDKEDAIAKYNYRYLNKKNTKRSFYFINMLLAIPKFNFEKELIHKNTQTTAQNLTKIASTNQNHDIEIIPYETLWDLILKKLL